MRKWCSKQELFRMLLPLLRRVTPFNDGNYLLTMPVVKGRCVRDKPSQTFDIGVFKCGKINSATMKPIYNESANKWLAGSPINGVGDCHEEHGDTRSPSLHTR